MINSITFSIVAFCISAPVYAQTTKFLDLGTSGEYRLAASAGTSNLKAGNAALVRIVAIGKKKEYISFTSSVLVACDGSWVSDAIQSAYKFDGTPTVPEMLTLAKQSEEATPLEPITIQPLNETELLFAKALTRHASTLCKGAAKEPRNVLIPVASTTTKDDLGTSISIVLGTSSKNGRTVDVWSRTSTYRQVPILDKEGQPWEYNGKIQKKKELTGKYSMTRTAFDCKERQLASYESVEYPEQGATPESWSTPRNKITLGAVVPGSVGEAQLDAVCAMYDKN